MSDFDFTIDDSVQTSMLPKAGKYRANIVKAEQKQSKAGSPMIALEMLIPANELAEQGIKFPVKLFDYIVDAEADGCKVKKKLFLMAIKPLLGPDFKLENLIGKSVEVYGKPKTDEFGDKFEVSRYTQNSVKDATMDEVPF
ncbi:MAG: DUF669 domain-containing protein [Erysipelotrichaceae bacterium]|nr:DUF669 domain-containing protein [Erysipelotrichaceae bacterium]